jgi:hypothetical protein
MKNIPNKKINAITIIIQINVPDELIIGDGVMNFLIYISGDYWAV